MEIENWVDKKVPLKDEKMKKTEKYQQEFIGFQDELKSYLYRLVSNKQESEDISQETYIKAFKNIDSFKANASFKTWTFTIATNLAKDSLKNKKRWAENLMDKTRALHLENIHLRDKSIELSRASVNGDYEIREHINFCLGCVNKTLLLVNQICLLLKEVYHFKITEIMVITDLSEGKVKHAIADARNEMKRIFKNRCALINKKGVCHQCTEMNNVFNPEQVAQMELNKIKMVKQASIANIDQLLDLRLQLAAAIDPLNAKGTDLHNYLLENMPNWAKL